MMMFAPNFTYLSWGKNKVRIGRRGNQARTLLPLRVMVWMAEKEELDQDARTVPRKSGATTKWYFMWLNPIPHAISPSWNKYRLTRGVQTAWQPKSHRIKQTDKQGWPTFAISKSLISLGSILGFPCCRTFHRGGGGCGLGIATLLLLLLLNPGYHDSLSMLAPCSFIRLPHYGASNVCPRVKKLTHTTIRMLCSLRPLRRPEHVWETYNRNR